MTGTAISENADSTADSATCRGGLAGCGVSGPAQPDRNELSPDKDTLPSITPTD